MTTATMKTVRVKRTTGEVVPIEIEDTQHYEVDLWSDDGEYMRHVLVVAPTAPRAKTAAARVARDDEVIESACKVKHDMVAVFVLHGKSVEARA